MFSQVLVRHQPFAHGDRYIPRVMAEDIHDMEQLKKNDEREPGGEPGLWLAPRPRHSEFKASQTTGLSNTRYHKKGQKSSSDE